MNTPNPDMTHTFSGYVRLKGVMLRSGVDISPMSPTPFDAAQDLIADRIEELEAKLAKTVVVLDVYERKLREFSTSTDGAAKKAEEFLDSDGGKLARIALAGLKKDPS